MKNIFLHFLAIGILQGCSHNDAKTPYSPQHNQIILSQSAGDEIHDGLYNRFTFKATLITDKVQTSVLQQHRQMYQWDEARYQLEMEKSSQKMSVETHVFVSFFTPERKNDNLAKKNSIWEVYLVNRGTRYKGEVKKVKSLLAELIEIYPYHSRWATPYKFIFPIPTEDLDLTNVKLIVTGPLGQKEVQF